jgi:DNA-directed RNA polymerase specialized sigma24 family protein
MIEFEHMAASIQQPEPGMGHQRALPDLLSEHYASVYRLAFSSLDNAPAAHQAARRAIAEAHLEAGRHPGHHPERLPYELVIKNLKQVKPTQTSGPGLETGVTETLKGQVADPAIARFNQAVDRLGTMEHHLLVLVYVLGWAPAKAADLLGVSESAARAQLALFHSRLCPLLDQAPDSAIPGVGALPALPGELAGAADQRLAAVLQACWPAPELSQEELEVLALQVAELAASLRQQQEKSVPYRRLTAVLGAAAVLLLCLTGGLAVWLYNVQGAALPLRATPSATAYGASTPFPQVTKMAPLTRRSSDEAIRQRWAESAGLWHSLSADLQTWRYGPLSYSGLPRAYRQQAWVLQPDQSIALTGLLGSEPGETYLGAQDRIFIRSAAQDETSSQAWDGQLTSLLPASPLRQMIFPASSPWASLPGSFRGLRTEQQAGREAVVYDWTNAAGGREARLWLDAQTGIILRSQTFGGDGFQTLIDESLLTSLVLERSQPPPALITGAQLGQSQPASADPAFAALLPTPTPAAPPADRPGVPPDPAPPGFDPSGGRLAFHFPRDPKVANAAVGTASQPAELSADGYSLGVTTFGLPWTLRCQRSADGRRLAFNTGSDGAAPADDSLRWFNLNKPQAIYQPLPDLRAASFAFAPSGRQIAVAGQGRGDRASGVYLVDLGTGESRLLLAAEDARSLLWSPDGEFLALTGRLTGQASPAIMVLHVDTGRFAYQGPAGVVDQLPADAPIAGWGTPFPVEMGGMDECASPPQP